MTSLHDVTDDDDDVDQLEQLMAEKAAEIFHACDLSGSGLLTKSDMRRLSAELPLTPEQLEDVFDSLDVARNGFLTSAEFVRGFGQFLGLSGPNFEDDSRPQSIVYEAESSRGRMDSLDDVIDDEDDIAFDDFLRNLGACGLLDDDETIKSMWKRLYHDVAHPEMLENFQDLLRRLTTELSRAQMDYQALKLNYRKNNIDHNEQIGNLYEEMESKLAAEKKRIRIEERLKERQLKQEMEQELEEKDRRLNELLSREKELERSLVELNAKEFRIKQENLMLLKEKEEIEVRLSNMTANRQEHTVKLQTQSQVDDEIRSLAKLQIAQWLELERESLVRQMNVLRSQNQMLIDAQDERNSQTRSPINREGYRSPISPQISFRRRSVHSQCSDDEANVDTFDSVEALSESQLSGLSSEDPLDDNDVNDVERQPPVGENSITDDNNVDDTEVKSPSTRIRNGARLFKIVFIGDSGVGKSSFIHRFCSQTFKPSFSSTIGVDFQVKTIAVDDQLVALQLWDTAGQERFRTFTKQYFRKADGILVMYDVTEGRSFKHVREWMNNIQDSAEDGTALVLLGNKMDLVHDGVNRQVSAKDGKELAKEYDALFFETSAKSGLNIYSSVEAMTRVLTEREDSELAKSISMVSLNASQGETSKANKMRELCCKTF